MLPKSRVIVCDPMITYIVGNTNYVRTHIYSYTWINFCFKRSWALNYSFGIEVIPYKSESFYLKRSTLWRCYKEAIRYHLSWLPRVRSVYVKIAPMLLLKLSQMLTGLKIQMIDGPGRIYTQLKLSVQYLLRFYCNISNFDPLIVSNMTTCIQNSKYLLYI